MTTEPFLSDFSRSWNFKKLLIPPLIMVALILSWLSPAFHSFWETLDVQAFHLFNSWIAKSHFWQNFWAIVNHNKFAWIHDAIMLAFFFIYIGKGAKGKKLHRTAQLIFSILFIALVILFINKTLLHDYIRFPRESPTLIFPEVTSLSEHVTWLSVKDYSRCSFPADHGTHACLFSGLVFILMSWRVRILASLYAFFFCLPRLVVGAHWITDILLGGGTIAVVTLSISIGSPLAFWVVHLIEKFLRIFTPTKESQPTV